MNTRLFKVDSEAPDMVVIEEAACILRRGGTVAFPTETVYGLGANGLDEAAVAKIFAAKGRPVDNPLILHIATLEELKLLIRELPPLAEKLMRSFWPGPLTLVLPRSERIPDIVTGGLDTVAVRMPDHMVAQLLIAKAGVPVAAPSANLSGRPSPTCAMAVWDDLHGKIDVVIDGGPSGIGVESTVVDMTGEIPVLLRPGGITLEELRTVLGNIHVDEVLRGETERPKAPGMKYTHYAPKAPVIVVEGSHSAVCAVIDREVKKQQALGYCVGVMATRETARNIRADIVKEMGDAHNNMFSIAAGLFSILRAFDDSDVDMIYAEGVSEEGIGLAIMNRLRKAAGYHVIHADEEQ